MRGPIGTGGFSSQMARCKSQTLPGCNCRSRVNFPASFSNLLQPFLSQDLRKLWLWGTILSNMWIHGPLMSRTVVLLDFFRRFTSFSFFSTWQCNCQCRIQLLLRPRSRACGALRACLPSHTLRMGNLSKVWNSMGKYLIDHVEFSVVSRIIE